MVNGELVRKHALAWLCIGVVGASCGGQVGDPQRSNGEGASGGSGSNGGSRSNGGSGGSTFNAASSSSGGGARATAGNGGTAQGGHPRSSNTSGSAGAIAGWTSPGTVANGGVGVGGAGIGRASAGRGTAGDDSTETTGAAGASADAPAGAIAFWVDPPATETNRTCKVPGMGYRMADTLNNVQIADGTDGVEVACKIRTGDNYDYDASGALSGTATALSDAIPENDDPPLTYLTLFSFNFAGTGTTLQDSPLTLSFFSSDRGTLTVPDGAPTCTMHEVYIGDGDAMLMIDCPLVADPTDDTTGCYLHGTIVFRSCDTSQ